MEATVSSDHRQRMKGAALAAEGALLDYACSGHGCAVAALLSDG